MSHTAPVDVSATGRGRPPRSRRSAGSGHRAVAGELAALAFQVPVSTGPVAVPPAAVPRPRPAAD